MPIIERTPQRCFLVFTEHLRKLVAATITETFPLIERPSPDGRRMVLSFREGAPIAVPIETRFGRLFFYLGQALEAVDDPGGYRLRTRQYWYRLQHDPDRGAKAAIRWEYDTTTPSDRYARHHAQMAAALALGDGELDLNKAHLPTGWVTVEEVIRFLVVDLGLNPPCGDAWPEVITDSETRFYEDFTGKRYKGPPVDEE